VRGALACVALCAALAGCGDTGKESPPGLPDPYANFERAYGSSHAVNDEYEIDAAFPAGHVVCVSDALTHIHGFHQFLDGDCSAEGQPPHNRVMNVWADYNAAEESRGDAIEGACSKANHRDVIDVTVPEDRGWTASCSEVGDDGLEQVIVIFLRREHEKDRGFGPDNIRVSYTARLYTDTAHRVSDIRTFETFLRQLKLAGTSLTVAS
jgi:hypothetical protein